jgi:hypothetical protein
MLLPTVKILLRFICNTTALAALILISGKAESQTYKVESIIYNGPTTKCINLVFLSEGFNDTELATYFKKVEISADNILNASPFRQYRNYFNVFAIPVPSKESGADHPRTAPDCPPESEHPKLTADTYFNSTFDSNNIHRLLVSNNYTAINNVILNNFPLFDQKIMLVNTPYYGGSGGSTATASLHSAVNEVVLHEFGHSFAGLGDEYWAGDGYAAEKINMTKESNPELVKWKNWLGTNGTGIFQYGTTGLQALWYRPHQGCKMRSLGNEFCPVCKEAIVLKILQKFGSPIKYFSPEQQNLTATSKPVPFLINLYKPDPNTLRTKWFLNGKRIALNKDSISVDPGLMADGMNTLSVEVLDTTTLIRSESHAGTNTYIKSWNISKTFSGMDKNIESTAFEVFPNPFANELFIESGEFHHYQKFEIIDGVGQVVLSGKFSGKKKVPASHFKPGVYFVRLTDGYDTAIRKIVKN